MASSILANVSEKAKGAVDSQSTKKVVDLARDTKDVHDKNWRITSDYGVKQNSTDDWLRVASEDKTGPSLLEDPFAREKVHSSIEYNKHTLIVQRFIGLTMSVYLNVSCMLGAAALLVNLRSSNQLRMSRRLVSSLTPPARPLCSYDFRPSLEAGVLLILFGMFVASRSSSTHKRVIGTSSETTSPSSSFRMR